MQLGAYKNNTHLGAYTNAFNSLSVLLLLKEVGSARLRENDIHLISPKTPAP